MEDGFFLTFGSYFKHKAGGGVARLGVLRLKGEESRRESRVEGRDME